MKVHIPTPLRSYTEKESVVDAGGSTVRKLLAEIDWRYPGFRFRIIDEQDGIREHIKIFINGTAVHSLDARLQPDGRVHIMCALSGG